MLRFFLWEGEAGTWKRISEVSDGKKFYGQEGSNADLGFYGKDILLIGFGKERGPVLEDIERVYLKCKELGKNKVKEAYMEMKFFRRRRECPERVLEGLLRAPMFSILIKGKKKIDRNWKFLCSANIRRRKRF